MNIPIDITFASGSNVIKDPFSSTDNAALTAIEATAAGATAALCRAAYDIRLPTTRPFWLAGVSLEVSAAATLLELGTYNTVGSAWLAAVSAHLFCAAGAGAGIVRQFAPSPGPKVPITTGVAFRIRASSAAGFRLVGMLDLFEEI